MNSPKDIAASSRTVPALRVHQWQPEWDEINFEGPHRAKPPDHFFVSSIRASVLRKLCGIERRSTKQGTRRPADLGIQRRHDEKRSKEIARFVRHGYPWSVLPEARRKSGEFDTLKQPGWLPTAIVVNIRTESCRFGGNKVDKRDLVSVLHSDEGIAQLQLPSIGEGNTWEPKSLHPIEVIDGQHRLWAFDPEDPPSDFEFPVVAFVGLDRTWQAYLFWTINIKPKRINASLAFDLYPLLRNQEWLEHFEGSAVYRETRAQELTEMLWAHEKSPWYHRINMLGERGDRDVRQAAWVRSLTSTFVKAYEGSRVQIGGLFGAPTGKDHEVLNWTREQQAAYLIYFWRAVEDAVGSTRSGWAAPLRRIAQVEAEENHETKAAVAEARRRAPFVSRYSLLNTDQGVRGGLYMANDLAYLAADDLKLDGWRAPTASESSDQAAVAEHLITLEKRPVATLLTEIATAIASFDWRTSATPGLFAEERQRASAFRGSSGYRELRLQLFEHIRDNGSDRSSDLAAKALGLIRRA
ncbi:MAG TPA: DGQHR domain-containing protein [Solirubrobacterales bacterium]|nr:DGQHR domain-containing protein [Solirubrobacterales bacterium]